MVSYTVVVSLQFTISPVLYTTDNLGQLFGSGYPDEVKFILIRDPITGCNSRALNFLKDQIHTLPSDCQNPH